MSTSILRILPRHGGVGSKLIVGVLVGFGVIETGVFVGNEEVGMYVGLPVGDS